MSLAVIDLAAPTPLAVPTEAIFEKAGSENFPVALRCLPARMRRHLLAIYGFARLTDDIGDDASGDRLALLSELEDELVRVYEGSPRYPATRRLAETVRELRLPRELFAQLIEANRRDQHVQRYATFAELSEYCSLSANPVGRLVLHVFDRATPERETLSDAVCTGLQIVEHCQDIAEDLRRGRVYLPADDLRRFECTEEDLHAPRATATVRTLVAYEVDRARRLLCQGEPLLDRLDGWSRVAVLGFIAGGHAAADACERVGFDVLRGTPRTRRRDVLRHAVRLTLRPRASR